MKLLVIIGFMTLMIPNLSQASCELWHDPNSAQFRPVVNESRSDYITRVTRVIGENETRQKIAAIKATMRKSNGKTDISGVSPELLPVARVLESLGHAEEEGFVRLYMKIGGLHAEARPDVTNYENWRSQAEELWDARNSTTP